MGFVSVTLGITQTLNMAIKKSKITWKNSKWLIVSLLSYYLLL